MPRTVCLLLALMLCSCASNMGRVYETGGRNYFYGVFEEIPLPKEMNHCLETTMYNVNSVKTGVQVFHGGVEANSLSRVMSNYMGQAGWQARGAARGEKKILLLFEKPDRYAAIHILDSLLDTEMHLYVNAKPADSRLPREP